VRRLIAALVLASLAACGGSDASTEPAAVGIEGVYTLKTINGMPLPVTFQSGASTIVLSSDVITILANGRWSETLVYRETRNGQTTDVNGSDSGYWVRDGDVVSLQSTEPGSAYFFATYANGSLTFSDPGFVQVFSR
jgi:hypothetical protein